MTDQRTNYDHLPMTELDAMLADGTITLNQLSNRQISEWASWEPDPLPMNGFNLSDPLQREEFLYQYYCYGEPLLFAAVAHIWDSLAEPRDWRCIKIGLACGDGGTGKMALVNLLNKMLRQCLEIGGPLPQAGPIDSFDRHHQVVLDHFATMAEQERALCRAYGEILDGAI